MSLVHSSREQGDSGTPPAVEPGDDELDTGVDSLSSLAEEAVPMRDNAARELDQMREERIRAVVGRGKRRLPRPTVNARVLLAGGAFVAILVLVVALSSSGGGSASSDTAAQAGRPAIQKSSIEPHSRRGRLQRLAKANPRRLAAIRAKRKAARRRVQRERVHRSKAHAEAAPSQSEVPTESRPPVSVPPSPTATTESAPPPASSPQPSTSSNPAQEEFGFEH